MSNIDKLVLITGCNRGFGRAILDTLFNTPEFGKHSHYVLLNRSAPSVDLPSDVSHQHITIDFEFADASLFVAELRASLSPIIQSSSAYGDVLLINNAGSLGPLMPVTDLHQSASEIARNITSNVTAPLLLTSLVTDLVQSSGSVPNLDVVNISSLAAVKPFEYWSVYCSGKAHREAFLRCFAHETKTFGSPRKIRVLSYAPGPLDTDMQSQIREQLPGDSALAKMYIAMHQEKKLITPAESARKLISLLVSGNFTSGSRVDYFDE